MTKLNYIHLFLSTIILNLLNPLFLSAAEAPGRPGIAPTWASAQKVGVGTSYEAYDLDGHYSALSSTAPISKVWFTLADGILTETYFPTVDTAQTQQTQLLITDGKTFLEEEKNGIHTLEKLDAKVPLFRVTTKDKKNRYTIIKEFFSHPEKNVVFVQYHMTTHMDGLRFYLSHNPRASNTGYHNSGEILNDHTFLAYKDQHYQCMATSSPFSHSTLGFVGTSDGETELKHSFSFSHSYKKALNGHIRFVGEMPQFSFMLVLSFGFSQKEAIENAQSSLQENSEKLKIQYIEEWQSYFQKFLDLTSFSNDQGKHLYTSISALKSHEDKTYAGAIVASLSIPWGDQRNEDGSSYERGSGGYHLIWPRDLFHIARAFMAIFDHETARKILSYFKTLQLTSESYWSFNPRIIPQKGAFPQNSWVDGTPFWGGLQMDEVSFPIILTWHLWQKGVIDLKEYWPMVKEAAHLIATFGPWTHQDRWEENYGISPAAIAVEISALICASHMAQARGAQKEARSWSQTADQWSLKSQDNIEAWTFTKTGLWGNGKYYLRIDGAGRFSEMEPDYFSIWDPNDNKKIYLASGVYLEKEIVDGGFLELVRYGVRSSTNEFILDTLAEYDEKIKVQTPFGPAWYRYLYDGYGEEGKGQLWTFLTAERAQYELSLLLKRKANPKVIAKTLDDYITTLENFSNEGNLFPEQIWENGKPTGSATPLLWTHAEYIKLLRSKADQKPFDLIPIVYERYKDF